MALTSANHNLFKNKTQPHHDSDLKHQVPNALKHQELELSHCVIALLHRIGEGASAFYYGVFGHFEC